MSFYSAFIHIQSPLEKQFEGILYPSGLRSECAEGESIFSSGCSPLTQCEKLFASASSSSGMIKHLLEALQEEIEGGERRSISSPDGCNPIQSPSGE